MTIAVIVSPGIFAAIVRAHIADEKAAGRQTMELDRGLQHHAGFQLADDAALDLLPRRLVRRNGIAAALDQRLAPAFQFTVIEQHVRRALLEVDPHPVTGA